jgi:hypothetical protein
MIHLNTMTGQGRSGSAPLALYAPQPSNHYIIIGLPTPGTGGNSSVDLIRSHFGYRAPFSIIEQHDDPPAGAAAPSCAHLMQEVISGFGRTLSRLPVVFGVSRQTLYNWRDGERPKEVHQAKLMQLAAAARTFSAAPFTPTSPMLDRTVAQGKSFLALLAEGADGADAATRLMRIVQRDRAADARFDAALPRGPKIRLTTSDFGAKAFEEDAQ